MLLTFGQIFALHLGMALGAGLFAEDQAPYWSGFWLIQPVHHLAHGHNAKCLLFLSVPPGETQSPDEIFLYVSVGNAGRDLGLGH